VKKAVITLATITALVSSAVADDSVLASTLGVGTLEGDPSIFATFARLNKNDNSSEMVIEASKDNVDINVYQPFKIVSIDDSFARNVSLGFESGYVKFEDYAAAGTIGIATTCNTLLYPKGMDANIGLYFKQGFDLTFGGSSQSKKEENSIYRVMLAVGYSNITAGISYKRINLFNPNQDDRFNFFVGYSFTW